MIVYDNAEDPDVIRNYWPLAGRGQAIITTRNPSFAFDLGGHRMEVTNWDNATGLKFLFHLLSTDIGPDLEDDESPAALELSEKLQGHALAISAVAAFIHKCALSVTEFVRLYDQHQSEVHDFLGSRSINALWRRSFKTLNPRSRALLAAMCFLQPDNIPQAAFEPEWITCLPASLSFCADSLR